MSKQYETKRNWWLWAFHPSYVEHRKYPGWNGYLAFYKFKCSKHGVQVNYERGYRKYLDCPECLKEEK